MDIAVSGAMLCKQYSRGHEGNIRFEYSPESFTGTEPEYALEVCNAVLEVWQPQKDNRVIINLPVTVSCSMPHVYANQIEYMCDHLKYRENVIVSLHSHNDRGCAIADSEMGLLAGADRIEGTLFGNGERTGNADIVTLAMNMFSQGVDPKLDFSNLPAITAVYEKVTQMRVYERQPYSGELVFAAFSGSHQDAIAKGMHYREEHDSKLWNVPYLPIDPMDVGRVYETDVIRINSQSGKGGIAFLLEQKYGFDLPAKMREDLGYTVKGVSDHAHKELSPKEVLDVFQNEYVNRDTVVKLEECHFVQKDGIDAEITILVNGDKKVYHGHGNGRLDAISNAIMKHFDIKFSLVAYEEHALQIGSDSQACAYVGVEVEGTKGITWGAGIKSDIIDASAFALISALNRTQLMKK